MSSGSPRRKGMTSDALRFSSLSAGLLKALGQALLTSDPTLKLETGRTHQIRVHMQAIGFPIVGDPIYGVVVPELSLDRQFLHAVSLSFNHPATGEAQRFTSPFPLELNQTLARIGPPTSTGYGTSGYSAT